jgi:hypothetical protein
MKKPFFLFFNMAIETIYLFDEEASFLILARRQAELHILTCPACARELKNLQRLGEIMKTDFFPPTPDLDETVMERLTGETGQVSNAISQAGFSFRGWVLIGFFMLLSLSSSFFGISFMEIAREEGLSFLLPVGITIGMVLTGYGAFFIGSHLKELSSRFGLR